MKRIFVFLLLFTFCSDTASEQGSQTVAVDSTTTILEVVDSDETTTTLIEIEQLETFTAVSYTHLTLPTKVEV